MFPKRMLAPGVFTVLNLFLGFSAVILAANHDFKNNFVLASWLILLAAIFDAFDGKIARATKSYSEFGEELDSLADIISFGMAPAFLIYQVHFYKMGPVGMIISFFPLVFGAIRLARFNITLSGTEKQDFKGLPIPAAAATLASFILFNDHFWPNTLPELQLASLMLPLVIILSLLMVTTIEFYAMPRFSFSQGRKNSILLIILIICFLLLIFFREKFLFPIAISYILNAAVQGIMKMGRDQGGNDETDEVGDSTSIG